MGQIDMINEGVLGSHSPESEIQSGGGGGTIEMYGGDNPFSMSHTPIGSEQRGGSASGIDMVGQQGLLDKSKASGYPDFPSDKGK